MKFYEIKSCTYCDQNITKREHESIPTYKKRKFCCLHCQHQYNTKINTALTHCDYCNQIFRRKNSGIKEHNFCSRECMDKYKTLTKTTFTRCDWCLKKFTKVNSQIRDQNFCSTSCMGKWQSKFNVAENSRNWKEGVSTLNHQIRSLKRMVDWRLAIFHRDSFKCKQFSML